MSIPYLTNEKYLEFETKNTIDKLTERINILTNVFPNDNFPDNLSLEEKQELNEGLSKQLGWGATGMEIPPLPETKLGLKYHAAAEELRLISDEFFQIRNHNPQYKTLMSDIKSDIKNHRDQLNDNQELEITLLKEINKLNKRIQFASIFPPSTLVEFEQAVRSFDNIQKKEQGSIATKDAFLFPGGTIVSSGPTCAEDGPGRWLPKPSDTFRIFADMLKPSVGFKFVPMFWYEMMGVNKIVGFILPDWIADILPGKYPIHDSDGQVKPNFKSKVLNVVTGNFEAFKIPVPVGHIWDSFLRVFLGLVFGIVLGVPLGIFMGLNRFAK